MIPERAAFALATCVALGALVPEVARADEKTECADAGNAAGPLRTAGKLKDAREKLVRCSQPTCPAVIRDGCASDLDAVTGELPTVVLRVTDAAGKDLVHVKVEARGVVVADTIDGNAVPIDPGPLKLTFTADGYKPADLDVVIVRGEKARVIKVVLEDVHATLPPPKPPPSTGPGAGAWVFLAAGGAGLVTFAALEGVAQSDYSTLKSGCGATHSCKDADVAPAKTKFIGAGVALGIGSAATAIALTWFIVHAATTHGPSVAIGVSPGEARFRLRY